MVRRRLSKPRARSSKRGRGQRSRQRNRKPHPSKRARSSTLWRRPILAVALVIMTVVAKRAAAAVITFAQDAADARLFVAGVAACLLRVDLAVAGRSAAAVELLISLL